MTCVVSSVIAKPCGDGVSGLKKIWAVEWDALDTITETANVISALTLDGVKAFFGWSFEPGQAQMTANINRSRENGTLFYEHKLNVKFNRYETTKRSEIKIVAAADLALIALDRNGKYWLLGRVNGMSLESGTGDTGKAMGDFSGFELNFTGMEPDLPIEVSSGVATTLSLT